MSIFNFGDDRRSFQDRLLMAAMALQGNYGGMAQTGALLDTKADARSAKRRSEFDELIAPGAAQRAITRNAGSVPIMNPATDTPHQEIAPNPAAMQRDLAQVPGRLGESIRERQTEAMVGQMFPAAPEPFTLGPGDMRFAGDGSVIAQGAEPRQMTTLERNLIAAGYKPGTPEFGQAIREQLAAPRTEINNNLPAPISPAQEAVMGVDGKRYEALATDADKTSALVPDLQRMSQLIEGGLRTGALATPIMIAQRYSQALGIDLGDASEAEAFAAIADRITPQMRVPGSGATSDFEARMMRGSLPQLMKTPGGNLMIADHMTRVAERKRDLAEAARQDMLETGAIGQRYNELLAQPLYTPQEDAALSARLDQLGGAGGGTTRAKPPSEMSDDELLQMLGN